MKYRMLILESLKSGKLAEGVAPTTDTPLKIGPCPPCMRVRSGSREFPQHQARRYMVTRCKDQEASRHETLHEPHATPTACYRSARRTSENSG
jgi:hypothetical protein